MIFFKQEKKISIFFCFKELIKKTREFNLFFEGVYIKYKKKGGKNQVSVNIFLGLKVN